MNTRRNYCAFVWFGMTLLLSWSQLNAQITAITAGTLIDPKSGTEKKDQTILVEAGKIKEIGPDLRIPPDATRIDLSHEVVFPGLMDALV